MSRVQDVAREIERQLRPLERQAAHAQEHAGLANELKDLEMQLAVDDLRGLQADWTGLEKKVRESEAEIEVFRLRYVEKEEELEKLQKTLEEKGLFVGDLAEQRSRCQSIVERLGSNMLLLEAKGRNLVDRSSEMRSKIHSGDARLAEARSELESMKRESEESAATTAVLTKDSAEYNRERTHPQGADRL